MTADNPADRSSRFVAKAAELTFPNAFNPYRDLCPDCDLDKGPEIRRRNLSLALAAALEGGVHSLWVARDLGHKGGRRTGLAMTDDLRLEAHGRMLGAPGLARATRGAAVAEGTTRDVWRAIDTIGGRIWLWNVFPIHPHRPGESLSNRLHTSAERTAAAPLLDWLIENLKPGRVVAVGRDAENALLARGLAPDYVRHPSMGGQRAFFAGMARLYGVDL